MFSRRKDGRKEEEGRRRKNPHLASTRGIEPTCLKFGDCFVSVWKVFGNCLEGVWQVFGGCLEGVLMCLEGIYVMSE